MRQAEGGAGDEGVAPAQAPGVSQSHFSGSFPNPAQGDQSRDLGKELHIYFHAKRRYVDKFICVGVYVTWCCRSVARVA